MALISKPFAKASRKPCELRCNFLEAATLTLFPNGCNPRRASTTRVGTWKSDWGISRKGANDPGTVSRKVIRGRCCRGGQRAQLEFSCFARPLPCTAEAAAAAAKTWRAENLEELQQLGDWELLLLLLVWGLPAQATSSISSWAFQALLQLDLDWPFLQQSSSLRIFSCFTWRKHWFGPGVQNGQKQK